MKASSTLTVMLHPAGRGITAVHHSAELLGFPLSLSNGVAEYLKNAWLQRNHCLYNGALLYC